jgi:hypothetical protein
MRLGNEVSISGSAMSRKITLDQLGNNAEAIEIVRDF